LVFGTCMLYKSVKLSTQVHMAPKHIVQKPGAHVSTQKVATRSQPPTPSSKNVQFNVQWLPRPRNTHMSPPQPNVPHLPSYASPVYMASTCLAKQSLFLCSTLVSPLGLQHTAPQMHLNLVLPLHTLHVFLRSLPSVTK